QEAAMQSRRARLPRVGEVASLDHVIGTLGRAAALAEAGGAPPTLERPALLVGPEGGWDPGELAAGLPTVGFGPTTLRAGTAAVVAGVVLCGLRSGVIRPL
ncbi:MAG: 16S rRNA (uracil(1498)-N(3))-methyltransferase, partial [Acidimicrobiales bacterium]